MKVVINTCYGGFGLSDKAIERCIELGMTVEKQEEDYQKADFVKLKKDTFGRHHTRNSHQTSFRCDPRVIQAVEELREEANGRYADLKIIEIPFDVAAGWEIIEYDGMEHIAEKHRTWY